MLEVYTKSSNIITVLVKTGCVVVYICREVNVYLHQDQPMKNGVVGEPSSEGFCNTTVSVWNYLAAEPLVLSQLMLE